MSQTQDIRYMVIESIHYPDLVITIDKVHDYASIMVGDPYEDSYSYEDYKIVNKKMYRSLLKLLDIARRKGLIAEEMVRENNGNIKSVIVSKSRRLIDMIVRLIHKYGKETESVAFNDELGFYVENGRRYEW